MPVDEFDLRRLARDLQRLYSALDAKKYERPKPPEIRTMIPSPGPSEPGSFLWLNRSVLMEQRLREVAFNALGDIGVKLQDRDGVVHNLLERIAFNAQPISELTWAGDFVEELADQERQLGKWLNPPEMDQAAKKLEPYHRAEIILQRLARAGHHHTRDSLRKLAERSDGDITTELWQGRTTYRFSEVLTHLEGKEKNADHHHHTEPPA